LFKTYVFTSPGVERGGATCWILWWRRCGANSDRVSAGELCGGGGGGGAWPGTAPASGGLGVAAAGVGARTLLRQLLAVAV